VMVGECMSRHQAWDDTVLKLRSRLSNWKVKTLFIGGRLTLLKSVIGASPLYNMSIFKVLKGILKSMEAIRSNFFNGIDSTVNKITWAAWDKILVSKKNGGLGVSSFHALNCALLLKWVWHFISQDGGGNETRFWYDKWIGDKSLNDLFPRLFALELDKEVLVADKMKAMVGHSFRRPVRTGFEHQQMVDLNSLLESVSLSQSHDRWFCDLTGDGEFRVKEAKMDNPNINVEEYIRLEEEKARRHSKVYNWETAKHDKIGYDEDVHDLRSVETEFPAIVFNDALTFEVTLSCKPMVSPLNDN
nr:RNA-directed DNA polymerase, eukaryota, reverse transcriptase zinc-binding domain protein [Tanacetum cinerariifolium]